MERYLTELSVRRNKVFLTQSRFLPGLIAPESELEGVVQVFDWGTRQKEEPSSGLALPWGFPSQLESDLLQLRIC